MQLDSEQRSKLINIILEINRVNKKSEASFNKYDSAKVKCGFAAFASGMLCLGVYSGNYEIKQQIGTIGVGALPFIFLGAVIYFFMVKREYDRISSELTRLLLQVREFGLYYQPAGKYSDASLTVIDSSETIDINELMQRQ